jgi:hypothetical protein
MHLHAPLRLRRLGRAFDSMQECAERPRPLRNNAMFRGEFGSREVLPLPVLLQETGHGTQTSAHWTRPATEGESLSTLLPWHHYSEAY